MAKRFCMILASGWLLLATGCTLCSAPDDYAYGCYGGKCDRVDRCHGRVFSAFDPAAIVGHEDIETSESYDYLGAGSTQIEEDFSEAELVEPEPLPATEAEE